jgi:hypothetical protein
MFTNHVTLSNVNKTMTKALRALPIDKKMVDDWITLLEIIDVIKV